MAGTLAATSEERASDDQDQASEARNATAKELAAAEQPLSAEQQTASEAASATTSLRQASPSAAASLATQTATSASPQALTPGAPSTPTELPSRNTADRPPAVAEGRPIRIRNPFDRAEIFQFPAGTTRAEARDRVAELLLQRAHERQAKRQTKRPARNNR